MEELRISLSDCLLALVQSNRLLVLAEACSGGSGRLRSPAKNPWLDCDWLVSSTTDFDRVMLEQRSIC
ncbi:hypothetical protein FEM48_ZijujUnG0094300 [Ziziphus jujuba var. spinosa]|uniref:Uncharacterized protein n=1 Tax=Ziziphus jujuba var. spinosa TaxID=714518 RepID=A0A978U8D1_ZIZJJ|nr:hypothetical protein FEM48_ZijujUnG0094300 [Ziziphus jujuba var. spinosa]